MFTEDDLSTSTTTNTTPPANYNKDNNFRKSDLELINKKKRTCQIIDFAVLADHRVKVNEKLDKYLNLAWELKR